jgi:hypothetical protein
MQEWTVRLRVPLASAACSRDRWGSVVANETAPRVLSPLRLAEEVQVVEIAVVGSHLPALPPRPTARYRSGSTAKAVASMIN